MLPILAVAFMAGEKNSASSFREGAPQERQMGMWRAEIIA